MPTDVAPGRIDGQARLGVVQSWLGAFGAWLIRWFVRLCGRSVTAHDASWLVGPIGPRDGAIGERPYELLARAHDLTIDRRDGAASTAAGLVPDFDVLNGPEFEVPRCDAAVRRFYEQTSNYHLDVWSHAPFPGRLFLWLIVSTVSRAMNQLNFPVSAIELSRGMTSEVIPMRNRAGEVVYTGWLRRAAIDGRVIYTGFYSTEQPPGHPSPCVKVVFPLPGGNATVVLKPSLDGGLFRLVSSGRRFGDPGFYRVVEVGEGLLKVVHLRSLRERFTVFTDEEGVLRCDHDVRFFGLTMLRLHYRMVARETRDGDARLET